jgi:hypothetical protein
MSDDNSANKFIKAVLKFDPTMNYKAVMKDGRTFKSKGYDRAEMEFNKRQPSKSNYKIKIT